MKTVWNTLAIVLLIATLAAVAVFAALFVFPKALIPVNFQPAELPGKVVLPTSTATVFVFPPTWTPTALPVMPTATLPATDTPMPTSTVYLLPTATNTATFTITPSITVTGTWTKTATLSGSGSSPSYTPTKTKVPTKTNTPGPTPTPCPTDKCGVHAIDDKAVVDLTTNPAFIKVNVIANDILNGNTVRIVSLLNCKKPCEPDSKGYYITKPGGAKVMIDYPYVVYYPASGFIGEDSIDYKIQSGGGATSIGKVRFHVTDGIQVPPTDITSNPASLSVSESADIGTVVGTFDAADPNGGPFLFSLVSGSGSGDNNLFGMSNNGTLRTAANMNCESGKNLSIRVQASDWYGFSYQEAFTVTLEDVNEFAPAFTSGSSASGVEGDSFVFNISTSDADCVKTRTVSLESGSLPDGLSFSADAGDGTARISGTPANGSAGVYNITLSVSDGTYSSQQSFRITVTAPTPVPSNTPVPSDTPVPP